MDRPGNDDIRLILPLEIEQYERKIYDLKQLIEISKGLNSTLEYNTLIDSILLTCMGQMQLLKAGIFLRKDIDSPTYSLHRNYKGFEIDHSREYELPADSSLIRHLEEEYRCYSLEEIESEIREDYVENLRALAPELIVPLMSKGALNGVIVLGERINARHFSEAEKEYLLNIGSLAGIAIHNSILYEMATTDMMTRLKSHHYFHAAIIEEIDRALLSSLPLTLLMIDVDYFKKFNDTYGHSAGDAVLTNVARIIKDCVRQNDIAARYGGEEFAVILPRTDIGLGLIVAERIRQSIGSEELEYNGNMLSVTASLGITQFDPMLDSSKKSLIERADKALYISKQNGRNLVSIL